LEIEHGVLRFELRTAVSVTTVVCRDLRYRTLEYKYDLFVGI